MDIQAEKILILDFGGQYTQLIARRVRELGVYCEIHRPDISAAEIRAFAPIGVILSGGPASVEDPDAPRCDPLISNLSQFTVCNSTPRWSTPRRGGRCSSPSCLPTARRVAAGR